MWLVSITTYLLTYLLTILGIDHNNKSFFIAFAFLPDETEGSYTWALEQIKALYTQITPTVTLTPEAISTDCDQALRNAISKVFPRSVGLLCIWHANKNVQQHCKGKFTSAEGWTSFFQHWQSIVRSPDPSEYQARLTKFTTKYNTPDHQECVQYIQTTWLRPGRKEALVQAWTNQTIHFGATVTSRLVYYLI
jgi:hypothetical protein